MTDSKNDGPAKGPERAATDQQAQKRPFATLDLKATEVKVDEAKAKAADAKAAAGGATPMGSGPEAATAAKVAAAARSVSEPLPGSSKAADPKAAASQPADVKAGATRASDTKAGERKPGQPWSVETAIGSRDGDARPASATAANSGSGIGRFLTHAAAGVFGGALALAGGQHMLPLFGIEPARQSTPVTAAVPPEIAGRIAGLEKTLRERLIAADTPRPNPALDQGLARLEEMTKRLASLGEAQSRLETENAALKEQLAKQPAAADAQRLAKLEEQLTTIANAAQADPQRAGRIPQLAQLTGQVRDLETALNTRLSAVKKELAQDIDTRLAATAEAGETAKSGTQRLDRDVATVKSDTTRLTQRLEQLKVASDKLDEVVRALKEETGGLKASLDGFKGEVDGRLKAAAKPADIAAAVAPVAQKVADIERNVTGIVRAEDDRKSNTERIVLSLELGNLKRAMERGAKYTAELAEVRRVAGDRIDLKAIERYQNEGVPTLATLVQDFRKVANAVVDAEAEQPGATVVDRMMTSAKSIVRVRKAEYAPDDASAEALVTRMEAALKEARLGDVVGEAKKLTEKARTPAIDWLKKVEARQTVDAALASIEVALKSSLGAGNRPDPTQSKPADVPKGTKQ
ncbi:MAG: hypothetical protein ACKVP7_27720 [Hyphomicrobiaceae bacterium]